MRLDAIKARLDELPAELAEPLSAGLTAVAARWPDAPEPDEAFFAKLAALHPSAPRCEDLYLAWWCERGLAGATSAASGEAASAASDQAAGEATGGATGEAASGAASEAAREPSNAAAIAAFEAMFASDLRAAAGRFSELPADELIQQLRVKLFVGAGDAPPKIREYAGAGSLRGWLRVTAVRSFIDVTRALRQQKKEQPLDEHELLGLGDPRGAAMRAELAAAVKKAFAAAVAELSPRERVFLRHAYVDRHTLDQIASHYAIHRTTVARTLAAARQQLVERTRAGTAAAVGVGDDELTSVIRALDSRIDLELSKVFSTVPPKHAEGSAPGGDGGPGGPGGARSSGK